MQRMCFGFFFAVFTVCLSTISLQAREPSIHLTNVHSASPHRSKSLQRQTSPYDDYILTASAKNDLDPELVKAVIKQESNFNRHDVSKKGAQGLMQLMPETARLLGVSNSFDPQENIEGGTRYLRLMLENFNGDIIKALAAYNAGPTPVKKYGAVPPYSETQNYVKNVIYFYHTYQGKKLRVFRNKSGSTVFTDQAYIP